MCSQGHKATHIQVIHTHIHMLWWYVTPHTTSTRLGRHTYKACYKATSHVTTKLTRREMLGEGVVVVGMVGWGRLHVVGRGKGWELSCLPGFAGMCRHSCCWGIIPPLCRHRSPCLPLLFFSFLQWILIILNSGMYDQCITCMWLHEWWRIVSVCFCLFQALVSCKGWGKGRE